jgi:hypothetical protein
MTSESVPEPAVGCLIGAWLVRVRGPVRIVAAELMAMGEQGLVDVSAGRDGYTLRLRYPLDGPRYSDERRALMRELLAGETSVALPRPASLAVTLDDGKLKGSRVSFGRLTTAVARAAGPAGLASRIRWVVLGAVVAGLAAAIAALVAGAYPAGAALGTGTGTLAAGWNRLPIPRSRRARAIRAQLLRLRGQMQETLRDDSVTVVPSWQLPWALLFLGNDDFALWRLRFARAAPAWWQWTDGIPDGSGNAGGIDAFNFYNGLHGFFAALRYSMSL